MEILLRTIGSVLFFVVLYMVFVLGGRNKLVMKRGWNERKQIDYCSWFAR
jgi:hypothetical protein